MKLIKARSDRRDGAVKSAGFHFTQHGKSQGGAEGDTAVTFSQLPGSCVCRDRSTQLVFRTNQRPTRTCAFDSLPAVAAGVKFDGRKSETFQGVWFGKETTSRALEEKKKDEDTELQRLKQLYIMYYALWTIPIGWSTNIYNSALCISDKLEEDTEQIAASLLNWLASSRLAVILKIPNDRCVDVDVVIVSQVKWTL